ncbi:phosphate ABC transporter substrate-binding protein PstS [Geomonas sp. Red69]|uniref:phosphate ABC transporter substrate-binding protein PstS n=1 Tax=Geomonas diazotrophica TaxID=2843197 RepID=UPI001C1031B1|nr:phosphate ABC transporter substrate-binding protein PstS [Geomonas diazotrophica]MBU5635888.1 phosphate ABC transporter substrate-binding protein PstS [Geomonas diazotrophica]
MLKRMLEGILVVALTFSALSGSAQAETTLTGAGATFPHPLYSKWFRDYQAEDPGVSFSYEAQGSGEGIRKILAREVDFGASDKFLSDQELKDAPGQLLHIPTVMGAVAVTYYIPGVATGLKLTPHALAGIYLGRITRWNDPLIARENRQLRLPGKEIIVVHRSDASGTTSIFSDYLSSVDPSWASTVGRGTSVAWPAGTGAKGSSALVKKIREVPYSIGYVEIAYALENDLDTAALRNRAGRFVKPTMLSTRAAAVQGMKGVKVKVGAEPDYRLSLVNQPGKDAYPIVGLTWLLVYRDQKDPVKGRKLVDFLTWQLKKAEKMTSTLHYTPLPDTWSSQVEKTIKSINVAQ